MLLGYGAASTTRAVLVADDPELLFEVQEDAVGGTLALADGRPELRPDLRRRLHHQPHLRLDAGHLHQGHHGATLQCKIVEFQHRADNTPAAPNSKVLVKINKHTELAAVAGI
jgi:hypothetical protein